jgi:hypothetical protein
MALVGPKEMTALPATALPVEMREVAVVLSSQLESVPGNTTSVSLTTEGQTVTMDLGCRTLLFRIVSGMGEQRV